jgi:hypothetical protein
VTDRRQPLHAWRLVLITAAVVVSFILIDRWAHLPSPVLATDHTPRTDLAAAAVSPREIRSGRPILSLVMDPKDLDDPKTGILANVMEHGREWERAGSIAFFDRGQLRFATGVGVRVHGGGSRLTSPRQGFRLFFRREYGARRVPAGVLFDEDAQPIRRLVVHNDVRGAWHFANPLAYDIAEAAGAITPDTYPVRFFVNGEFYGVFVLTERFDENFFAAHWGHDDIRLDQADFDALSEWTEATRPLTMAAVADRVDLQNLTRWFLAVAFCATRDAYQGPGQFLDLTRPRAGYFWVNWDMDESFRTWQHDSYQYLLNQVDERRRGRNRAEARGTLLSHLFDEDPAFRDYYKRMFVATMNHHLTPAFLRRRYEYYRQTSARLGVQDRDYLVELRTFLEERPRFFWTLTEQWLNSAPSQVMALSAPPDESISIDEEMARDGFQGRYFPDLEISLRPVGDGGRTFRGWRVNGKAAGTGVLKLKIEGPTTVEALYDGAEGPGPRRVATDPPTVDATPAPAPLKWIQLPGRPDSSDRRPLWMLAHEVTAGAFASYAATVGGRMPTQPSWFADATHPVMNVTWDEARAFCTAQGGRLPTGAEWDYAALGGQPGGHPYPWGDVFAGEANLASTTGADSWVFTSPVGSFRANGFGLYDMIGNLWEWTNDPHDSTTEAYDVRVVKGGSWDTPPQRFPRTSGVSRAGRHNMYVGFRCVR